MPSKTTQRKTDTIDSIRRKQLNAKIPLKIGKAVKMLSELTGDKSINLKKNWPKTAIYKPILRNVIGKQLPESVVEAVEMGLERENQFLCGCAEGTDCATNPLCKCRETAVKMASGLEAEHLIFGQPVDPNVTNFFWNKMMFGCSERCDCKGRCSQNALREMDSDHEEKFVIRRTNEKGFCLFTKVDLKKGLPVLCFKGEIVGKAAIGVNSDDEQYALEIIENEKALPIFLDNPTKKSDEPKLVSQDYLDVLTDAYNEKVWLNPLRLGNCARFISHSCEPNMEPGRVYSGGFSPADFRVVMFAKEDIQAGSELTFSYGKSYEESHLRDACLCNGCLAKKEKENEGSENAISEKTENQKR